MNKDQLVEHLNGLVKDSLGYNDAYIAENEKYLQYYLGEPFGDEESGKSQYVSTDVADVVEADMPSLARIFLGPQDIMKFEAISEDEEDIAEAEEKTRYINWLVRQQKDSFKTILDWLKEAEISKAGVVKFYCREEEKVEVKRYNGLSSEEIDALTAEAEEEGADVEIAEEEGGRLRFKLKRKRKVYVVENIAPENFLISKNAKCLDSALIVGDRARKKRGELLIEGYDRDMVNDLPQVGENAEQSRVRAARWRDQGEDFSYKTEWATEEVELQTLYPLVDWDDDGVAERRRVVKCGSHILENDYYDMVPYACLSAILMPMKLIGRSRAEVTASYQYLQSHLHRQVNDNIYQVNRPRTAVSSKANLDDLMIHRTNGVVRVKSDDPVSNHIHPLVTPYIGDSALQIIQHIDQKRAQTTGALLPSQGLAAADIAQETATRFKGVEDASKAKVELMARCHAETGFRRLYEGMLWLVMHYQDDATEIAYLGKPLSVDPTKWKHDHICTTQVGLGAGDEDAVLENMASILGIHQQLADRQSPLTDSKKVYNTLAKILKNMGEARVGDFFNDPEVPEDVLLFQNEQMKALLGEIGQQNPLAEAEKVKAEASIMVNQMREDSRKEIAVLKEQISLMKDEVKAAKDSEALRADLFKHRQDTLLKLAEIEEKYKTEISEADEIYLDGTFHAAPNL